MNLLIKSATLVDSGSDFHNQVVDILIKDGRISQIGQDLNNPANFEIFETSNLHISRGWFDSGVSFGEPGYEERETLENGLLTASLSGFTKICLLPSTNPVPDSQADINYIVSKTLTSPVTVLPIGALSVNSQGNDLAELYDMHTAGAVAFLDSKKSVENPNLLKLALQYVSSFDGLIMNFPQNSAVANKGVMNEGEVSTSLGLKGIPAIAEELQIARDVTLLEYAGGRLHIPTISTAKSVKLIRQAKEKNFKISCSVAVYNLILTDEYLNSFDTRYKVLPPLRSQEDCVALREALLDGTIDLVTTDHTPLDVERKKLEFDLADFGTIGLESAFGVLNKLFGVNKTVEILTRGGDLFNFQNNPIREGEMANLSLFNPETEYTFGQELINSSSKNSAFLGEELKGIPLGIIANNQFIRQGEHD